MTASPTDYRSLLATYLKPQWRRALLLLALLFGSLASQLANPQIIGAFIDTASGGGPLNRLITLALLFLVIALAAQAITVAESYVAAHVGWTATNRLRADLTLHCLRLDPEYHSAHPPGELIERVDGDVAKLGNFFSRFVVQLLGNALLLVAVLVISFRVDWRVGAGLSIFAAVSSVLLYRLRNVAVPHQAALRQADADLFGLIEEHLSGVEDLRTNGAIGYALQQLHRRTRVKLYSTRRAWVTGAAAFNSTIVLLAIGTAIGLGLGIYLFQRGSITLGTVYLIFAYAELLRRPIEQLSRQVEDLQQAAASIGRVQQLFATQSAISDGPGTPIPAGPPTVTFEHVSFGYSSETPVLHDLSFTVPAGTTLGLLGRTGSGKTTITRLLFRLYDPSNGVLRLSGVDLRAAHVADLRRRIGLVTQEILLFHATVRDNLTIFDRTVPDARIETVLEDLGLQRWRQALPQGLDTVLAPDGAGLSAGEAQLLAFARVFLQDPDLVILDEASSRLDPATEQAIERAVEKLLRSANGRRTAIIIAHRLQTVQRADSILIVEQGRMREYGSRAALESDPGSRFAELLRSGLEEVLA